jgi:flagellar secretion chaperone FliS
MTNPRKPNEYLKVKIQTARPSELLLLLFDGAIRFTQQAKGAILGRRFDEKNNLLLRAQNIVLELLQALDPRIGEELYANVTGLYRFCYERLVRANLDNDERAADEALAILEHVRETWRLAVHKAKEEGAESAAPPPTERHVISIQG